MNVSVVIPNHNGGQLLGPLLSSIRAQTVPPLEVLVVDDASSDDSRTLVREEFPEVRLLLNETNSGFAATANRGLTASHGEIVALVNNDTVLHRDWIAHAVRPFQNPQVGVVATRIVLHDRPDVIDSAGDIYLTAGTAMKRGCFESTEAVRDDEGPIFSACAAAALYRRAALEAVGRFDERLEAYYEDVDLGFRLRLGGWNCVYVADAVCRHHVSASYRPRSRRFHFLDSRNSELVFWSNLPLSLLLRYLPSHVFLVAAQLYNRWKGGHAPAYLAGKTAFLRNLGLVFAKRAEVKRIKKISRKEIRSLLSPNWFRRIQQTRRAGAAFRSRLGATS